VHRDLIIMLAARHKLPAVYPRRLFVTDGGLISYGVDRADEFRRAASYVDRILKGEKPTDLPVQAPTKYELVIKSQDCQSDWPRRAGHAARPRRRGDRMHRARVHHGYRRRSGMALVARAQQAGRTSRIGLLWPGDAPPTSPRMESFRQGLRASGFIDGHNITIDLRYAQQGLQQLLELAIELMRMNIDAIFAGGNLAAQVAKQATETIPIVVITALVSGGSRLFQNQNALP
jgi:ABC-type uncharacterized transport system substrate-binding protein